MTTDKSIANIVEAAPNIWIVILKNGNQSNLYRLHNCDGSPTGVDTSERYRCNPDGSIIAAN